MAIKKAWVVCSMDGMALCGDDGEVQEFKSEASAIKRAKDWVLTSADDEAWIYCLSHVVSRPEEVDIERVK